MKDFKSYLENCFIFDTLKYHRLTSLFVNDCLRFRMKLYRRVVYLKLSDLTRYCNSDILYYYYIGDKYVHVFYINLNNLDYAKEKKKKISSRPSA